MKFDAAYYDRFYRDPETRATTPQEQALQAQFIASYLRYLDISVSQFIDIGCGLGALLGSLQQAFPEAVGTGVEVSRYLCEAYGWNHGSAVDYRSEPQDLVICTDVLGYLADAACTKAINNLAKLTHSALYLSVITSEDIPICDTEHTDMRQHVRSYAWYRQRLDKHFVGVGGGLFLKKPVEVPVWRLEQI
jgi:trans-aconitate methyltransferase